jgi:DNA mismatch repair protein MutS
MPPKTRKPKTTEVIDSDDETREPKISEPVDDVIKTREEYVKLYKQYRAEYGEKMFLLYEVGSFYEVYSIKRDNQYYETNIEDFSRVCSLAISANTTMVSGVPYVMTGFNSYMIDKYIAIILAASYTAVVYSQYEPNDEGGEQSTKKKKKDAPKKIRKLDGIYSPGTYVPYDVDQSQQMTNNVACIWIDTIRPLHRQSATRDRVICGIASANIYTGQTTLFEYQTTYYPNPTTFDELERALSVLKPSEVIFITSLSKEETDNIIQYAHVKTNHIHILYDHANKDTNEQSNSAMTNAKKQTYIKSILDATYKEEVYDTYKEFQENTYATQAFTYLLHFMKERNPDLIKKIKLPLFVKTGSNVLLANYTLRQLNVIDDGEHKGQYSSLISLLNKCASPMGRRKTYEQIVAPTYDEDWLNREYETIQYVLDIEDPAFIQNLKQNIGQIKDIEKICRQIILKRIFPSSIYSLYKSVQRIRQINISLFHHPQILDYLSSMGQYSPNELEKGSHIESVCMNVLGFLDKYFVVEKCKDVNSLSAVDHTIIQPNVNKTLDAYVKEYAENTHRFHTIHSYLNNMMRGSNDFTADNSQFVKIHETEKSGASLQITKTRSAKLKSILASIPVSTIGSRVLQITKDFSILVDDIKFLSPSKTTDEITSIQIVDILRKMNHLKEEIGKEVDVIYKSMLDKIEIDLYDQLDVLVEYVTYLDVLHNKAYIAREYHYCRPIIPQYEGEETPSFFNVREVRHPLIEHIQQNEIYVTNDLVLSQTSHIRDIDSSGIEDTTVAFGNRGILIYGTNAVGKTSFIRAVGLAILMAQSGFYVPAASFEYKPYKSIFSRILGNDNLFKGLSTFAVEMSELRVILKYADQNSLILGDELCSGTEMESALSIFTTGLMTLYDKEATFLFATHFHEILEYDELKEMQRDGHLGVKHMAVHYDREIDALVYDRKLMDGAGNRLYGLEVCKSLYLESDFLERAYEIRNKYHSDVRGILSEQKTKYNARKIRGICEICNESMGEEVHHLMPQKDADQNGFIGHFHKNHPANLANICEKCHDHIHKEERGNNPIGQIRKKTTKGYKL